MTTELLPRAFAALGMAPTERELALVGDALIDADAIGPLKLAEADREAFAALAQLALASGSSSFVALDLIVQVTTGSRGVRSSAVRFDDPNRNEDA